jgi:hypothetical protein
VWKRLPEDINPRDPADRVTTHRLPPRTAQGLSLGKFCMGEPAAELQGGKDGCCLGLPEPPALESGRPDADETLDPPSLVQDLPGELQRADLPAPVAEQDSEDLGVG